MVWRRLKQLWGGTTPTLSDADVETDEAAEQGPSQEQAAPPPDPVRDALATVDAALRAGDTQGALLRMRALLLRVAGDRRVLERAAIVLAKLEEGALAEGFKRAAATREAAPLVALAYEFLSLDDLEIALAMAEAATVRDPHGPQPALAVAAVHDAMGDFQGVLDHLERFAPAWPDREVARLYGAAVIFAGAWERWDGVAQTLVDDPEGAWIVAAAERARSFPPEEGGADLRHRLFIRYGTLLLDADEGVEQVDAERLASWMAKSAALLLDRVDPDMRIAYVGPRSEVLARWLAESLGITAIPISARLPDRAVIIAVADDDDLEPLYQTKAFYDAPSVVLQAIKDPARTGVPLADVIGILAETPALPFEGLEVERAADRVPPKLLVRQLKEAAGAVDEAPVAGLLVWAEQRSGYLSLDAPVAPEDRASFNGW
ncbi:MAG: hypothetical protein EP329_27885 [Deltaproteobacteria bacterium]|nr:MAG: hypothetical protein EP329_27885 [Deltaproteobacteria bacterium]